MTGRAATNTLREALAVGWPEGDHAEPNVFTESLAALALVEAALDAAEGVAGFDLAAAHHDYHGYRLIPEATAEEVAASIAALAAALRAAREGK